MSWSQGAYLYWKQKKQQPSWSGLNENSHQRLTYLINTWFPLGGGMVLGGRFNDFRIMPFPCCSHVNPTPFPLIILCLVVVEQDESSQLLFPAPAPCLPAYLPACLPAAMCPTILDMHFILLNVSFPHINTFFYLKKIKIKEQQKYNSEWQKIHSFFPLSSFLFISP